MFRERVSTRKRRITQRMTTERSFSLFADNTFLTRAKEAEREHLFRVCKMNTDRLWSRAYLENDFPLEIQSVKKLKEIYSCQGHEAAVAL